MSNTMNKQMTVAEDYANQYRNHTDQEIRAQAQRFASTAKRNLETGCREWAYAKNGMGGEHYGRAREAYNRAAVNQEKADILNGLLAERTGAVKEYSFAGSSSNIAVRGVSQLGRGAVGGAVAAGILETVKGMLDGDEGKEIAENALSAAAEGAMAGSLAVLIGGLPGLLLSGPIVEGSKTAFETFFDEVQFDPVGATIDAAQMGEIDFVEAIDSITGPFRDVFCDFVDWATSWM